MESPGVWWWWYRVGAYIVPGQKQNKKRHYKKILERRQTATTRSGINKTAPQALMKRAVRLLDITYGMRIFLHDMRRTNNPPTDTRELSVSLGESALVVTFVIFFCGGRFSFVLAQYAPRHIDAAVRYATHFVSTSSSSSCS